MTVLILKILVSLFISINIVQSNFSHISKKLKKYFQWNPERKRLKCDLWIDQEIQQNEFWSKLFIGNVNISFKQDFWNFHSNMKLLSEINIYMQPYSTLSRCCIFILNIYVLCLNLNTWIMNKSVHFGYFQAEVSNCLENILKKIYLGLICSWIWSFYWLYSDWPLQTIKYFCCSSSLPQTSARIWAIDVWISSQVI